MIFEPLAVGPFQCNCTILGDEESREAVVIDPGDDLDEILEVIHRHGLRIREIIHTHAHIDHVGATEPLRAKTGGRVGMHADDRFLYENLAMQARFLGLPEVGSGEVDRWLGDGDGVAWGSHRMEILHTPGHTPGSLSFLLDGSEPAVFTGDTLFSGGIGRTDLWGGSLDALLGSIRRRLMSLADEVVVYPGHGPATTIGRERRANPFLRGR